MNRCPVMVMTGRDGYDSLTQCAALEGHEGHHSTLDRWLMTARGLGWNGSYHDFVQAYNRWLKQQIGVMG